MTCWLHLPLAYDEATGKTTFTSWGRRKLWLIDGKSSLKKAANVVYADQPLQLALGCGSLTRRCCPTRPW